MRPARRRRTIEAVALSVAAHAAILVAMALHAPLLRIPPPERGPPIAVIPVLLLPRTPPRAAVAGPKPAPIRLHQRAQRPEPAETPVKPLVIPMAEPAKPPPAPAPKVVPPAIPDPIVANATKVLRGLIGCANPERLPREEREKCEQGFAAGAKDAPFAGLGLGRGKADDLARAGARREANFRYKRGETPPAPGGNLPWDGQRSPPNGRSNLGMGSSSTDLGATPATKPF